jgi:hypothetical protein
MLKKIKQLICSRFGHDPNIALAAVRGPGLCYAKLSAAKILANMVCRRCGETFLREYRTQVILQMPKTLEEG